jgi:hypothetical protein
MRLVATPDSAKENYSADIPEYLIEIYKKDKPYTITPIVRNVTIGKFCSIAPNVQIGHAPHQSKILVLAW